MDGAKGRYHDEPGKTELSGDAFHRKKLQEKTQKKKKNYFPCNLG